MQGQRADVATQTSCVWDPGPVCVVLLKQCSSNLQLGGGKREQAHHKPPFLLADKSFLMTTAIPESHDSGMHPSLQMLGAWASELGDEFSNRSTMLLLCRWAFNGFVRHLWSQDSVMEHKLMRSTLRKTIKSTIYGQIKLLIHLHCYCRYRWVLERHVKDWSSCFSWPSKTTGPRSECRSINNHRVLYLHMHVFRFIECCLLWMWRVNFEYLINDHCIWSRTEIQKATSLEFWKMYMYLLILYVHLWGNIINIQNYLSSGFTWCVD